MVIAYVTSVAPSGLGQRVGAVLALLHLALDEGPGHLAVVVPGVVEDVVVLDGPGVEDEVHLAGPAVGSGLEDLDLLRRGHPLRVGREVGDDRHDVGRGRIDDDRLGGLVGHGGRLTVSRGQRAGGPGFCYSRVGEPLDSTGRPWPGPWATVPADGGEERTRRARVQRSRDHRGGSGRGHPRHAGRQRRRARRRGRPAPAGGRPVAGRHVAAVRRGGPRRRQGAGRRRCRRRRPRGPAGEDPVRVDRLRLRDLDRRWRRRPHLRDLQPRPGGLDPLRLRRHRRDRRARRARAAVESVRDQAPDLRSVHVIDDDAVGALVHAGKDVPDSELEARRATPHRRQRGHADLHQRHHRPAQGLRAHPRELPVRDRQRHHACSTGS